MEKRKKRHMSCCSSSAHVHVQVVKEEGMCGSGQLSSCHCRMEPRMPLGPGGGQELRANGPGGLGRAVAAVRPELQFS